MKPCNPSTPKIHFINPVKSLDLKPEPEVKRPWIGTYLGIETPSPLPEPEYKQALIEFELHILKADLTVKIVTLYSRGDGWGNEAEEYALNHIAWVEQDSVAFAIYRGYLNEDTGQFKRETKPSGDLGLRIGKKEWTWFNSQSGKEDKRGPFVPDYLAKYR